MVIRRVGGVLLVAVIDALGHGTAAAETASVGVAYLEAVSDLSSVGSIVEGLHGRLHGTRGAAAMICVIRPDGSRMTACSVGNIELRSLLDRIPVMNTPGILGSRLRNMRVFEAPLQQGERLVMFSDGVSPSLRASDASGRVGLAACDELMRQHRRYQDDATVAVIDVKG
ncbi:MAG: SpoIIE family protein phosphatase [Polyangiaceae bacterium]|nr:SpoIIE family protein phosphatase [Polyangiaceae bacterium]